VHYASLLPLPQILASGGGFGGLPNTPRGSHKERYRHSTESARESKYGTSLHLLHVGHTTLYWPCPGTLTLALTLILTHTDADTDTY